MFCTECGAKNNEGSSFCGSCGTKIVSAAAVSVSGQPYEPPIETAPAAGSAPAAYAGGQPYEEPTEPAPAVSGPEQPYEAPPPQAQPYEAPPPQAQPYEPPTPQAQPYEAPSPQAQPAPASPKGKIQLWVLIASGVGVLVLVVGALWLFTDILPWTNKGGRDAAPPLELSDIGSLLGDIADSIGTDIGAAGPESAGEQPVLSIEGRDPESGPGTSPLPVTGLTGIGGIVHVVGDPDFYDFEFTPGHSGRWVFITSDNGGSDPYLEVSGKTEYGMEIIAEDDDSAGDLNALLYMELEAGKTYPVRVRFITGGVGRCTLTIRPAKSGASLPGSGGTVRVTGIEEYEFTPDRSGIWEFSTFDTGGDPFLRLFDSRDVVIAHDDDSGDGLNSLISAQLNAGETYYVETQFGGGMWLDYTLSATFGPGSAVQSISVGALRLPGSGGSVRVDEKIVYEFVPDRMAYWLFETSDIGENDPFITLYDDSGTQIGYDDDGGKGLNVRLMIFLVEGDTYYVHMDCYDYGSSPGSYTLTVNPPIEMPGTGGTFDVVGPGYYLFAPTQTGNWLFRASGNSSGDPEMYIFDDRAEIIAEDDDGGGGLDALLSMYIEEGEAFHIYVGFVSGEETATLTVVGGG